MIFAPLAKTIDYVGQFSIQVPGRDLAATSRRPQRSAGMIPRLFNKTAPPLSLPERIGALQAAPAEVVAATALGADEEELRAAALQLLPDGEPLRSLAGLGSAVDAAPPAVRHAAEARLARLIDDGAIDFAAFVAGAEQRPELLSVVALCHDPERLRAALARITDQRTLARIVVDSRSSQLRQLAATAIDDPAVLTELLREIRGKDKTAYRIIQQKCDALTAVHRHAEEATREGEAVCATLERHATKPFDVIYGATLEVLTQRWAALAPRPQPEVEQRAQAALERCREVIAVHDRELARQAAEHAAREAAAQQARDARERAELAEQQRAAEQAETDARESAAAAVAREAEERALWERRAAEEQAQREIGSLIRLAREALKAGNSRKAARFRQSIEDVAQVAAALPVALPVALTKSLEQLDAKLNELRQWKDYVAAPKRIELIEEMEALAGSEEEPVALAERIRALQQEWRTINKGIASDALADSERFKQAYLVAFKPCQEHLAAQAAVRRKNLAQRVAILERLKAVEAGQQTEQADHSLLLQVLREAPREWRSHSPVDAEAARAVEIEFHRLMDRLRKRLGAWYDANEADKQALITQARALAASDDSAAATDGVKRLQSRWKETGPASREQSERLWSEFRALCDSVFKKREQNYAAQSAALDASKSAALALCDQVERAAATPPTERSVAKAQIGEWRTAFEALGELPRADARGLRDRFERALTRYEAGLAQQDRQDAEAAVSNLLAAARHIGAYERALAHAAPAEECEGLRAAAEAFIAGVPRWPKGGLAAAKQALGRAAAPTGGDDAARERVLRMLCIRCEILSSTPTPAEDEGLRREYQLKLLMQSMGQAAHADDRDWDALLLEWVAAGGASPAVHAALEGRFLRCLAKRPAKSATASPFQHHDGRDRRAERERRDGPSRSGDRGPPRGGPRR